MIRWGGVASLMGYTWFQVSPVSNLLISQMIRNPVFQAIISRLMLYSAILVVILRAQLWAISSIEFTLYLLVTPIFFHLRVSSLLPTMPELLPCTLWQDQSLLCSWARWITCCGGPVCPPACLLSSHFPYLNYMPPVFACLGFSPPTLKH